MQLSLVAILVMRLARSRGEEQRLNSELEAARAVQQVLVPRDVPTIPRFQIESVYRPAGEVGGDFFQIVPIERDGVLLTIGDVSGKGMPAAMTVSLLVGTFSHAGRIDGPAREDTGAHEPPHARPQPGRLYHLPGSALLIRMAAACSPMPGICLR